jgi:amino acid adenylation domain-containing protein
MNDAERTNSGIAIIGMAGRFPKARNIDEFWRNLCAGVEGISLFSNGELDELGVDGPKNNPNYVKARGILDDAGLFDAAFFGINPREAEVMDPQHRVFLECAWEALESAGCDPERYEGAIGVFAGMSMNTYLPHNLLRRPEFLAQFNEHQIMLGNDKDFLPTRVSYKLNLRGPSLNIQTACSTSLVAVCVACQNLLNYECDLALAGAVSITFPQRRGYLYQEGGIASPDGHCRVFDAKAAGTVAGEGAGIVVLKRLEEALADGDQIFAVIKGCAINNDGSEKVGYTAPGVEGQAEVIATAQAMAGFAPDTISYIEAHGTGTPLGDPIEVEGLTKAFRAGTAVRNFCGLGSVKSNIGHLDTAAGVAGLIKTALALHHKVLPPTLHFETPNPKIALDDSPFYVNAKPKEWPPGKTPRRAGVSSFGIGGTNAHVVLEEAPVQEPSSNSRPVQLLLVSAKSGTALDQATANLAAQLKQNPMINLADVAYTMQAGRREFGHRRMLVCRDVSEAVEVLGAGGGKPLPTRVVEQERPPVVFMFPGQGAQQVNMGRELYETEPVFRSEVDRCCDILRPELGCDLRTVLYPEDGSSRREEALTQRPEAEGQRSKENQSLSRPAGSAATQLTQTALAQPALFVIEYALAKLWISWGVQPEAMIGHSIGEYATACLAGVFSLEDALALIAARGRMMQQLPPGSMLAVRLPEQEVGLLLNEELSLSAVNGVSLCVVSGPREAIQTFQEHLSERGVACTPLHTSHAFHSSMMQPIFKPFAELVSQVKRNSPKIPYLSNVTGAWITASQATDPVYWAKHLRQTVRFADGLAELFKDPVRLLLEVGPGQTLSNLARQHPVRSGRTLVAPSLRRANDSASDLEVLLSALGQLWLGGVRVDWRGFYAHERRRRVTLPTYPFERKLYFVEPLARSDGSRDSTTAASSSREERIVRQVSECASPLALSSGPSPMPKRQRTGALQDAFAPSRGNGEKRDQLATPVARKDGIASELRSLLGELSGRDLAGLDGHTTFVELGFDSLFLTKASLTIERRFNVKVAFRQLLEQFSSFDALAAHLDSRLPSEQQETAPRQTLEISGQRSEGRPSIQPSNHPIIHSSPIPLTAAQQEIWFASQMSDGASCAYNETRLLHFRGPLQAAALWQALQQLVARHEALRTSFSPSGDAQHIRPQLELDLPLDDLSLLDTTQRERRLESLESAEASRPFDLAQGPLLRARLVRLSVEHHLLLLTIHHLVCDGRSWGILLNEAAELYSAQCRSVRAQLPPPLQLSEFAKAQTRRQSRPERAAAEAYWLNQFTDGGPLLDLPADHPRSSAWTFEAAREFRSSSASLARQLKRMSAEHDCTLFTTLLAGYYLWLHRLTGQDDIVVGIPTDDRAMERSERLVGHCLNFLPLRLCLDGHPQFAEFLVAVKSSFLEAYEHQHCGFGSLIQRLDLPRHPGRMPLVSVTFNLDRLAQPPRFFGLETDLGLSRKAFSSFDLSFNVTEIGEELRLDCRYSTSLFEPQTIQRWLGHYQTLLEDIAANPSQRIGELSLLTEPERHQILVEWNGARTSYPPDKTLPQWFEEQVERTPNAVAVVCEEQRLTYRELNRRANQLAHSLRSLGVGPEVLVGLFVERSLDLAVGLLGILKAGGAYLPLDPVYPRDRLAFILEDAQARVLVTQERLRDQFAGLPAKVLCLDTDSDRFTAGSDQNPNVDVGPKNLAYVIYTSGSTGKPKGSLITHYNAVRLFQATEPWFGFNHRDVWTLFHSHAFDFSVWEFWGALLYGGRLVVAPYLVTRSPAAFYELLVKEQVTVLNQTPSAFRQLMAAEEKLGMSSGLALRLVIFGGEALEMQSLKPWFARHGDEHPQLVNMYGITETTVHVTYRPLRSADVDGGSLIGVPIPDLQVYLLDRYGQPAPIGVPGEIYVGGPGLARGYLHRDALTTERFVADPFQVAADVPPGGLKYSPAITRGSSSEPGGGTPAATGARLYRTGDLARWLPGRDLEYLGRMDQQVKIRGFRVEPGEIEAALTGHPAVRQCVVVAREDPPGETWLIAYLVTGQDLASGPPTHELRRLLQEKLPDYMIPSAFVFLDALPLTPNGKIDRKALPAPDRTRSDREETLVAPSTLTEEALSEIWREVLRLDRVGVRDNFFELGGHSLLMTQVISRVREAFQIELPIRRFFESPTIADLAAVIEESLVGDLSQSGEAEARPLAHSAG